MFNDLGPDCIKVSMKNETALVFKEIDICLSYTKEIMKKLISKTLNNSD